jgi:hypothetical protein
MNIIISESQLTRIIMEEQSRVEILLNALTKSLDDNIEPKLSKEEFNQLLTADPTTRLNNVNIETEDEKEYSKIKSGKYFQWLIKNYLLQETDKKLFMEDLYKITEDLIKFDRFKDKIPEELRNIDKLTPKKLYDIVKDFSLEKKKASKEEKQIAAQTYEYPGSEIVFKGSKWTVIKISDKGELGKDAACFFGGYHLDTPKGETRWCTSSPGYSHFERYIKDGPLYIIIPNDSSGKTGEKTGLPAERYQLHLSNKHKQFMDSSDSPQKLDKFLDGTMKELKSFFTDEIEKQKEIDEERERIEREERMAREEKINKIFNSFKMIRVNNGDFHFEYKGNGKVYMKIIDNVFYCDVPIYNKIKQDFGRYLEGNIIKYIAKQGIEIEDIKIISPEKLKSL